MSSFIVQNKTINRIVNFCYWQKNDLLGYQIKEELKKVNISLFDGEIRTDKQVNRVLKQFGLKLLDLNLCAYYSRYKHNLDIVKDLKDFKKSYVYEDTPLKDREIHQVLKSIHCFLYQCSEGNIDKTPLFKCIERIGIIISNHLIHELLLYKSAEWE